MKPLFLVRAAKRHTFFLMGVSGVLVTLGLSGWWMSQSTGAAQAISLWVQSNEGVLFAWRLALYASVFFAWNPLIKKHFQKSVTFTDDSAFFALLAYRRWLVVGMVLIEVFIVQNGVSHLVGML